LTAVDPTTKPRSRRDVLCGLMVALVAPGALVAACGSEDTGGNTGNSGGSEGNGGSGGGGGATALSDIPDGGGLIVDGPDGKALLVRNGNEVKAFNAACTHQGTIVEAPQDGVAVCPNHGSEFDAATGDATKGPATQPLAEIPVTVEGDQVTFA
jgi:cytochrome b6-f complex iron-sulfur subunit